MRRMLVGLLGVLSIAGGAMGFVPPTDAQVEGAIRRFGELTREADLQDGGANVRATDRIKWADDSLEGIDVTELSPTQIAALVRAQIFPLSSRSKLLSEHLASEARADTVEGAEAAALRLSFLRLERDTSAQQLMVRRALTHPKLGDALRQGRGATMFGQLAAAKAPLLPDILALKDVFTLDMPPVVASRAHMVIDTVVALTGDEDIETRQPLRRLLLEMVRAALASDITDNAMRDALLTAEKKLNGAFMKGELIGHPAPPLDFTWTTLNPPVRSLAELKGKVVLLDFWATWCGPYVVSAPDIRKLQERYAGYPVVILAVTSLQGLHFSGNTTEDCAGDPEKEMRLMGEYVKEQNFTWPVAFTAQSVFNPEYYVNANPHGVIIDADGKVRHRKLHPNDKATPLEDKVKYIDALLKEAKLRTPPPLSNG